MIDRETRVLVQRVADLGLLRVELRAKVARTHDAGPRDAHKRDLVATVIEHEVARQQLLDRLASG